MKIEAVKGVSGMHPANCRKSINLLVNEVGVDAETAYNMMRMTAALMDLRPEDDEVVQMILKDCGVEG